MRYNIYKVLSIQVCTQNSLEMCYVPCIWPSLIPIALVLVSMFWLNDHGFLLGEYGLEKKLIKQHLLSCCTVFLPQPLPARPREPRDLQVLCHPQGLRHVRVVAVEPLLARLWLGQRGRGAAQPAPPRAERARGHRQALPGAGGEGGVRWRREGTALPQVRPEMLLPRGLGVKKPLHFLSAGFLCGEGCEWCFLCVGEIIDLVIVSCDYWSNALSIIAIFIIAIFIIPIAIITVICRNKFELHPLHFICSSHLSYFKNWEQSLLFSKWLLSWLLFQRISSAVQRLGRSPRLSFYWLWNFSFYIRFNDSSSSPHKKNPSLAWGRWELLRGNRLDFTQLPSACFLKWETLQSLRACLVCGVKERISPFWSASPCHYAWPG